MIPTIEICSHASPKCLEYGCKFSIPFINKTGDIIAICPDEERCKEIETIALLITADYKANKFHFCERPNEHCMRC